MVTGVIERSKVAGEDLKAAGSLVFADLDGRLGLKNSLSDHKNRLQYASCNASRLTFAFPPRLKNSTDSE